MLLVDPHRFSMHFNLICLHLPPTTGPPIDAIPYQCVNDRDQAAMHLRDRVKLSLEAGITRLLQRQKSDPNRYTMLRWKNAFKKFWANLIAPLKNFLSIFSRG